MPKRLFFFLMCCSAAGFSQTGGGVMDPKAAGGFSVPDCFKANAFSGSFRSDSIKAAYALKGTRIWRTIALENKQNGVLFNSSNRCVEVGLFEIIKFGLLEKKLNAFSSDNFNEAARYHLSPGRVKELLILRDSSEASVFDAEGNSRVEKTIVNRYLLGGDIVSYLIKEDWIVNSHDGKTEKHIIALAPLVRDAEGKARPLFWLYYAEWRELFGLFEARNFYSYERISYRQVFEKKYFISVISRESNVFERSVKSYRHGEDALMENERIKEKLNNSEADLFSH